MMVVLKADVAQSGVKLFLGDHSYRLVQGVNSISQLLLFLFHLFSFPLFLLLYFIVFPKKFNQKSPKNGLKLK